MHFLFVCLSCDLELGPSRSVVSLYHLSCIGIGVGGSVQ